MCIRDSIWFIYRKKKKATAGKLKKWMIYISIIVFAGYFMSNLVKCTISFASLEKAVSFYGNTKPQGQPLIGTETALVPQLNDGLESVSYTHLDVYKRQDLPSVIIRL